MYGTDSIAAQDDGLTEVRTTEAGVYRLEHRFFRTRADRVGISVDNSAPEFFRFNSYSFKLSPPFLEYKSVIQHR